MVNLRQAILTELKRQKKTRYWLSQKSRIRPATVYDFLNGRASARLSTAEKLMRVLGLEIRPKE